jgi:ABC-2 type transport system permease protein
MELLSGSTTPIESMPRPLQMIMQLVPSTHYVAFSQAVLYRGAGLDIVWGNMLSMVVMSALLFGLTLLRFRRAILQM